MPTYICGECEAEVEPHEIAAHRDTHDSVAVTFTRKDLTDDLSDRGWSDPRSPAGYVTVEVMGRPVDLGPDATVDDAMYAYRYSVGAKQTRQPSANRHRYTPANYGLVREAHVGRDEDGDLIEPESDDDLVSWELDEVEHGDRLYLWSLPDDWDPYPEYADASA